MEGLAKSTGDVWLVLVPYYGALTPTQALPLFWPKPSWPCPVSSAPRPPKLGVLTRLSSCLDEPPPGIGAPASAATTSPSYALAHCKVASGGRMPNAFWSRLWHRLAPRDGCLAGTQYAAV